MSSLLPLMDTARANVDAAYNGGTLQKESGTDDTPGYVPQYDAYLTMAVGHLNAYEYDTDHNYNTEETIKFEVLEPAVKGGSHSGWHHENPHDGDENKSRPDHTFTKFKTFDNFEVEPDLPLNYECKGDGEELFRTPYEAFYYHKAGVSISTRQMGHLAAMKFITRVIQTMRPNTSVIGLESVVNPVGKKLMANGR